MVCRWVPVCWGLGWVGLLHRPEDRAEGGQPRQQWPLRRSDQGGRDIHFYVDCQYFQLFPSFIDRGSCWFCWCSGLYSANGCCYGTNCYCCFGLHYQLLLFWPLFSTAVAVLSSITNCCRFFDLHYQLLLHIDLHYKLLLLLPPLPTVVVILASITNCCFTVCVWPLYPPQPVSEAGAPRGQLRQRSRALLQLWDLQGS